MRKSLLACADDTSLFLGKAPPEEEHHTLALLIRNFDDLVSKLLPPTFGMGIRLSLLDGKAGIQKENSLLSPTSQVSVFGPFELYLWICLEILVDVHQGWRRPSWGQDTKAKPVCLVWPMIGVLSDYDCLYICDGRQFEGVEDVLLLWVDLYRAGLTVLLLYSSLTN